MMASTSSIELTFLLGSSPLPVDRKLRAQFFYFGRKRGKYVYRKSIFSSTFDGGGELNKEWGIKYSEKHQREQGFSRRTDLWFPGVILSFSNNTKIWVTILHRELVLERQVEKVKHIKLEVMTPKTKSNMNFHPE